MSFMFQYFFSLGVNAAILLAIIVCGVVVRHVSLVLMGIGMVLRIVVSVYWKWVSYQYQTNGANFRPNEAMVEIVRIVGPVGHALFGAGLCWTLYYLRRLYVSYQQMMYESVEDRRVDKGESGGCLSEW